MGKAFYRKYRSRSLNEIVGQDHITTTLKNAIKSGRISHAYLFTGPRGVGKTSIARILAYEINNLPYSDDNSGHIDIIEIDAASNRRIDEIRELRDKVHVAPALAKYKVYIIDEVHMLTREAFNALLKTLEEPPAHVVFVLATTEVHKLPETIVSRTQRFTFKPIAKQSAINHLAKIAKDESIDIDEESLSLIVEHANGSFRDSISLLDQLGGSGQAITVDIVRKIVGVPPSESIAQLHSALTKADHKQLLNLLDDLYMQGYQPAQIAKNLSQYIRSQGSMSPENMSLLKNLLDVPASHDPRTYLELVLLESALTSQQATAQTVKEDEPEIDRRAVPNDRPKPMPKTQAVKNDIKAQPKTKPAAKNEELWDKVLEKLRGNHNTLYGIARMANADLQNDKLVLAFQFPFHQRRCNEQRNRERVEAVLHELSGKHIKVECVVDDSKEKSPKINKASHKPKQNKESDTLETITQVFGGGEVLD